MAKYKIPAGLGVWLDLFDGGKPKGGGAVVTCPDSFEPHVDWQPAKVNADGNPDESGTDDPGAVKALAAIRAKHPGYMKREADKLNSAAKAAEELNAAKARLEKAKAAAAVPPARPPAPPVDNEHVAPGAEQFSAETIAANKP
jgi:hypothetical protein